MIWVCPDEPRVRGIAVKEAVLPFTRFDVDILLGPEMRSTGEVMGFDDSFGMAYAKAQAAAGNLLPKDGGTVVVTVNDRDKVTVTPIIRGFRELGFEIVATGGTYDYLSEHGVQSRKIFKVGQGRPNLVDAIVQWRGGSTRPTRRLGSGLSTTTMPCVVQRSRMGYPISPPCRRRAQPVKRSLPCGRSRRPFVRFRSVLVRAT